MHQVASRPRAPPTRGDSLNGAPRAWRIAALSAIAAAGLVACNDDEETAKAPESIDMSWFGITNWHHPIREVVIMLDGETIHQGSTPQAASVTQAIASIKRGGSIDVHVVRWMHSVDCGELSNGTGGAGTFGFLIVARTGKGDERLNVQVSDSGAGGPDLTTARWGVLRTDPGRLPGGRVRHCPSLL